MRYTHTHIYCTSTRTTTQCCALIAATGIELIVCMFAERGARVRIRVFINAQNCALTHTDAHTNVYTHPRTQIHTDSRPCSAASSLLNRRCSVHIGVLRSHAIQ